MSDNTPQRYNIFITPLIDSSTYGTEINVSDYVVDSGVTPITEQLEGSDFEINFFKYSSVNVRLKNISGLFSDESDARSMFKFSRDLAKVKVVYIEDDQTESISFEGLVNEEATRHDYNYVTLFVAAKDSVIRKTNLSPGLIDTGDLFSDAIKAALNQSEITRVFSFDPNDVTVDLDLTIDDGSVFDNISTKDVINNLLTASNSVLIIENDEVKVNPRSATSGNLVTFYVNDSFGRDNVLDVLNYSSGMNRAFNNVIINKRSKNDLLFLSANGLRQIEYTLDFLTDANKIDAVAQNIVDNFKAKKRELDIVVRSKDAMNISKLDLISLDFKPVFKPIDDLLPVYGQAVYGQDKYPFSLGGLIISKLLAFKVIGKREDPNAFKTTLRLRERGISINDGIFTFKYGEAIYGESLYHLE